jgi:archaeal type IV pilus assembly protein PilA
MDFKKLFKNNDAVSPVIGVILMVAITVILAAAIGSSVFGQGPAKSAPQANLDIKANATATDTNSGSVKIEHLGGDTIQLENPAITKVTASLNGNTSVIIDTTSLGDNGNMSAGDVRILKLESNDNPKTFGKGEGPVSGDTVNIKIIDVKTNQLISNKDVRF